MRTTKFILLTCMVASLCSSLAAIRTSNRYFPALERPETYHIPKSGNFTFNAFFTDASTSFKSGDDRFGIPELWGFYDLKDVIQSRELVETQINNNTFTNPFASNPSLVGLIDKSVRYDVGGALRSRGIGLQYEQQLWLKHLAVGVYVPFFEVTATQRYTLNPEKSATAIRSTLEAMPDAVDVVRRQVHSDVGFEPGDWKRTGLGDVELHLRWHNTWEYRWLMRSIRLALQVGTLIPSGEKMALANPVSVPFGTHGHNALFFDILPEFELKQDWRLGLMFSWMRQYSHRRASRIPVANEPLPYSSMVGDLETHPARTWKFSLYFILENVFDGMHLQARTTYLKHNEDNVIDRRSATSVAAVPSTLESTENLSAWHAHYFTFQLNYNTKDAQKNWWGTPNLYLTYDFPFEWLGGRRAVKTHQLTFGLELHF